MSETLGIATRRFNIFLKELAGEEKANGNDEIAQKLLLLEEETDSDLELEELANTFYSIYHKK
ncbi:hypothetical protein bcgnr5369_23910 [Bacillus cereus]|uniref:Uncharacterized protein n=1 Tax=Bacillus thuringiensis TaxID=1428 RepID=A0A9X6ZPA9_BACTU|nr:hypothetical protein [Bacillus thuringiensis]PFJ27147.1 hypothetical protein COJ15_34520 [Bacillus thuringiensis]